MNTAVSLFFFVGSSSFFQVIRACIKALMSLNLGQIPQMNMELAAIDRL